MFWGRWVDWYIGRGWGAGKLQRDGLTDMSQGEDKRGGDWSISGGWFDGHG